MSAFDLLCHLRAAGFTVTPGAADRIRVTPASALTDEHRAAIRDHRTDLLELLSAVSCPGPDPVVDQASTLPAPDPDPPWLGTEPPINHPAPVRTAPADAVDRPYRLTKAEGDAAHYPAWDDAAIARFQARVTMIRQRGFNPDDADDLAERLHLRDTEGDDRRLCLECSQLERSGHCAQARAGKVPGAYRHYEPVVTILHRCPVFKS